MPATLLEAGLASRFGRPGALVSVAWFLVNKPVEGETLVPVTPRTGSPARISAGSRAWRWLGGRGVGRGRERLGSRYGRCATYSTTEGWRTCSTDEGWRSYSTDEGWRTCSTDEGWRSFSTDDC